MTGEATPVDGRPTALDIDEEGVDRTLIREFLALTPVERLDLSDAYAREIEELRSLVHSHESPG